LVSAFLGGAHIIAGLVRAAVIGAHRQRGFALTVRGAETFLAITVAVATAGRLILGRVGVRNAQAGGKFFFRRIVVDDADRAVVGVNWHGEGRRLVKKRSALQVVLWFAALGLASPVAGGQPCLIASRYPALTTLLPYPPHVD